MQRVWKNIKSFISTPHLVYKKGKRNKRRMLAIKNAILKKRIQAEEHEIEQLL